MNKEMVQRIHDHLERGDTIHLKATIGRDITKRTPVTVVQVLREAIVIEQSGRGTRTVPFKDFDMDELDHMTASRAAASAQRSTRKGLQVSLIDAARVNTPAPRAEPPPPRAAEVPLTPTTRAAAPLAPPAPPPAPAPQGPEALHSFDAFLSMSEEVENELAAYQAELVKVRSALNQELKEIEALLDANQTAFDEVDAKLKVLRALRRAR